MKFYAIGSPAVWDTGKGKVLCRFKKGMFETDNNYIIEKLEDLGYSKNPLKQPARSPSFVQSIDNEGNDIPEPSVDAYKMKETKITRQDHIKPEAEVIQDVNSKINTIS